MKERSSEKLQDLGVIDFVLGILKATAERRPDLLLDSRDRSVDTALADAQKHLNHLIEKGEVTGIEPMFYIAPHPIHGDSETVAETMTFLASLGYIKPVNMQSRYYRFGQIVTHNTEESDFYKRYQIPGDPGTYRQLAGRFITIVSGGEVEPLPTSA